MGEASRASGEVSAVLHIHFDNDSLHSAPLNLVVKFVDSLHTLVSLTAMALETSGRTDELHVEDYLKNYDVAMSAPKYGSFALPLTFKDLMQKPGSNIATVFSTLLTILSSFAASGNSVEPLRNLSAENQALFANELNNLLPGGDFSGTVAIDTDSTESQSISITAKMVDEARRTLKQFDFAAEDEVCIIKGSLFSVVLASRVLWVRDFESNEIVKCTCLPEVFDRCPFGAFRNVQITGKFKKNAAGVVTGMSDVSSILPVDLSPVKIQSFTSNAVRVCSKQAEGELFPVELDPDYHRYYMTRRLELGVDVFSETRDGLIAEIREALDYNWSEFVHGDATHLAEDALSAKQNLLKVFAEVQPHA